MTPAASKNYSHARLLMSSEFANYLLLGISSEGTLHVDYNLSPRNADLCWPEVRRAVYKSAGLELPRPQPKINGVKKRK